VLSNELLCCNYPEPVPRIIYPFIFWLQDHNKDYIVEFPDISPSSVSFQLSKRRGMSIMTNHRRFFLREVSGTLPHPHLWYSTKEAIKALELFLDAGSVFSKSLTYRYNMHLSFKS
jgi:alpha-N-acetylglucosaminidase